MTFRDLSVFSPLLSRFRHLFRQDLLGKSIQSSYFLHGICRGIIVVHFVYPFRMSQKIGDRFLRQNLIKHRRYGPTDPVDRAVFYADGIKPSFRCASDLSSGISFAFLVDKEKTTVCYRTGFFDFIYQFPYVFGDRNLPMLLVLRFADHYFAMLPVMIQPMLRIVDVDKEIINAGGRIIEVKNFDLDAGCRCPRRKNPSSLCLY